MFRAEHKALVQEANIGLVNIRSLEVTYFLDFFTNFATQAALLAGLITGAISQTPALTAECAYFWKFLYFIGSAVVLALAMHMLITTVFIVVFGEGIALRGPEGSMVKAIDGMVEEQYNIAYIFATAMFFYVAFQGVGMYFVVMDTYPAALCSVGVLIALLGTYNATLRIYNRFHWDKSKTGWDDLDIDDEKELKELNPDVEEMFRKNHQKVSFADIWSTRSNKQLSPQKRGSRWPFVSSLQRHPGNPGNSCAPNSGNPWNTNRTTSSSGSGRDCGSTMMNEKDAHSSSQQVRAGHLFASPVYDDAAHITPDTAYTDISTVPCSADPEAAYAFVRLYKRGSLHNVAGYLSIKSRRRLFSSDASATTGGTAGKGTFSWGSIWTRRFFVLRGKLMYFYPDKSDFLEDASNPINKRPIDLDGYSLLVPDDVHISVVRRTCPDTDTATATATVAPSAPRILTRPIKEATTTASALIPIGADVTVTISRNQAVTAAAAAAAAAAATSVTAEPYYLSLVPIDESDIRQPWRCRCDTESEYIQWIKIFALNIPLYNL